LLDAETDRILGCLGIGSRAAEIVNLASAAMKIVLLQSGSHY